MNTRLENLVLSGLVALAISTAVSGASTPTPKATHGISTAVLLHRSSDPSASDKIAALTRRVDALQKRLGNTENTASAAQTDARAALSVTDCLIGGQWVATDTTTGNLAFAAGTEVDAIVMPILDANCVKP